MKQILYAYKHAKAEQIASYCIPIIVNGAERGRLRPVTAESIRNKDEIGKLAKWREASSTWFASQFPMTEKGTLQWLEHKVIEADDRILFIVEDEGHSPIGHVGLIHYDEIKKECEYDNLLRGEKGSSGVNIIMYASIALGVWSLNSLNIERGYINVLADNYRAIHIYKRLGAQEVKRQPLIKHVEGNVIRYVAANEELQEKAEREMLTLMITKEAFLQSMQQFLK